MKRVIAVQIIKFQEQVNETLPFIEEIDSPDEDFEDYQEETDEDEVKILLGF